MFGDVLSPASTLKRAAIGSEPSETPEVYSCWGFALLPSREPLPINPLLDS